MKQKVALGLSGGVDSAVSAALLIEQGYEVTGVFMECYNAPGCRTNEDHKDALDIALQLKIPFEVLDYTKAYQEKVLDYFVREYMAGRTPNPDVMCNREIKFGLFYDWARAKGFDEVATGHYARIQDGTLLRGADEKKDQSYFLHLLRAEQLDHILFPLGEMMKREVREEAERRNLVVARKPDSQGICFIGEVPVREFLHQMGVQEKIGEVVDIQGEVIGEHKGVWFYTIGQRHGFEVKVKQNDSPALFVVGKDVEKNRLVVGIREQAMKAVFEVDSIHWIHEPFTGDITVRIRHGGELISATLEHHQLTVTKPVFGVAPGQAAVFYYGEVCLGGGVIG
jgi:tRNA-uridine 2-sulfurtransferase